MLDTPATAAAAMPQILDAVRRVWGYDTLRPLQAEAIDAGLRQRDSLVVMPTGGGKSLCYQVPPLIENRTDLVVSPLISLMKDQVDGLRENGYPAVAFHSGMPPDDLRVAENAFAAGAVRLALVAPERLFSPRFIGLIQRARVRAFAIDEAHCISHWGHDFRPEYRKLGGLKQRFADVSVHAYTATATPRVQQDVAAQLNLVDPLVLVGIFDRPNLIFRIRPRLDVYEQVRDTLRRHRGEAAIVYCISRRETEEMAEYLRSQKIRAENYHAGMEADDRRRVQDSFSQEKLDVVVATVAFGMGIDRSDVRCVIHAGMPKSIEHYQQEAGRAGRDGLPAECVMFYSNADVMRWESILTRSRDDAKHRLSESTDAPEDLPDPDAAFAASMDLLSHLRKLCAKLECRHRGLSEYFGQQLQQASCGACDVCLGEIEGVQEGTVTAQKILSCVARVEERFGVGHVCDVLLGAKTEGIRRNGHEKLSTYGLLKDVSKKQLTSFVFQLLDQDLLSRRSKKIGEQLIPLLTLNPASWDVMRGKRPVYFVASKDIARTGQAAAEGESWEGVDRDLFEELRIWRRKLAESRNVPPFVIFNDATLRELARRKPATPAQLRQISGVGQKKVDDLGPNVLAVIATYCKSSGQTPGADFVENAEPLSPKLSRAKTVAFELFSQGMGIEEVAESMGRAASTVTSYLCDYIEHHRPVHIETWVKDIVYEQTVMACKACEADSSPGFLTRVFQKLDGRVPYDTIKLVAAHRRAVNVDASGGARDQTSAP